MGGGGVGVERERGSCLEPDFPVKWGDEIIAGVKGKT